MKAFQYLQPANISEASELLAEYGRRAIVMAGGTDIVPQMKRGVIAADAVIGLGKIPELRDIRVKREGLEIGAMVTLGVLERNRFLSSNYPALRDAVAHVAVPSIRTAATLGGNICLDARCIYRDQVRTWQRNLEPCYKLGGRRCHVVREGTKCHASFAADTVPILIALRTEARIVSPAGERSVPLETLYTGNGIRPLSLQKEILAQVSLPAPGSAMGAAYKRYSPRKALDFQKASAAVCLAKDGEACSFARIVLGGVAPGPVRLIESEQSMQRGKVSDELLRQVASGAPGEALKISGSGRLDEIMQRVVSELLYESLGEAWARTGTREKKNE